MEISNCILFGTIITVVLLILFIITYIKLYNARVEINNLEDQKTIDGATISRNRETIDIMTNKLNNCNRHFNPFTAYLQYYHSYRRCIVEMVHPQLGIAIVHWPNDLKYKIVLRSELLTLKQAQEAGDIFKEDEPEETEDDT